MHSESTFFTSETVLQTGGPGVPNPRRGVYGPTDCLYFESLDQNWNTEFVSLGHQTEDCRPSTSLNLFSGLPLDDNPLQVEADLFFQTTPASEGTGIYTDQYPAQDEIFREGILVLSSSDTLSPEQQQTELSVDGVGFTALHDQRPLYETTSADDLARNIDKFDLGQSPLQNLQELESFLNTNQIAPVIESNRFPNNDLYPTKNWNLEEINHLPADTDLPPSPGTPPASDYNTGIRRDFEGGDNSPSTSSSSGPVATSMECYYSEISVSNAPGPKKTRKSVRRNLSQDWHGPKSAIFCPEVYCRCYDRMWMKVYMKLCAPFIEEKLQKILDCEGLSHRDLLHLPLNDLRNLWRVALRRWHSTYRNLVHKGQKENAEPASA